MLTENIAQFISLFWLFLLFLFFLLFTFLNFLYYCIFFFFYFPTISPLMLFLDVLKEYAFYFQFFFENDTSVFPFFIIVLFTVFKKWAKKNQKNPSMIVVPKVFRWFLRSWIAMLHLCDGVELFVLVQVVWNNNTQQCYQHLDLNWYQDSC